MGSAISRSECLAIIFDWERKLLTKAAIDHKLIPIIMGQSGDLLTQERFEAMGGQGPKKAPYSEDMKQALYQRMYTFLEPMVLPVVHELIVNAYQNFPWVYAYEYLEQKAGELKTRCSQENQADFRLIHVLFQNHIVLFEEHASKAMLKINPDSAHQRLCPIMQAYDRELREMFNQAYSQNGM